MADPPQRPGNRRWIPAHLTAAEMRAQGYPWAQIARDIGRKEGTARKYACLDGWADLVEHYRREQFAERERAMMMHGQGALEDLELVRHTARLQVGRLETLIQQTLTAPVRRDRRGRIIPPEHDLEDLMMDLSGMLGRLLQATTATADVTGYRRYRQLIATMEAQALIVAQRAASQRDLVAELSGKHTDETDLIELTRSYHEAFTRDPGDQ